MANTKDFINVDVDTLIKSLVIELDLKISTTKICCDTYIFVEGQ